MGCLFAFARVSVGRTKGSLTGQMVRRPKSIECADCQVWTMARQATLSSLIARLVTCL